jgi:ERCC4-type nuclease
MIDTPGVSVDPELPDSIEITPASAGCIAKIVIDQRELNCAVTKEIDRMRVDLKTKEIFSPPRSQLPDTERTAGIDIELRTLSVGDYVLSDRVCVERKTTDDFLATLLERRELFSQLRDLKMAYRRPVLIVEGPGGQDTLFTTRMIDASAIWGVLEVITVSLRIPILYTNDCAETARVLCQIAVKQQNYEKRSISLHGKRSHMRRHELQEYVVSSIPDVGPTAAKRLLSHFGSIEGIVAAPRDQLIEVHRIGPKIADNIRGLLSAEYVLDKEEHAKPE